MGRIAINITAQNDSMEDNLITLDLDFTQNTLAVLKHLVLLETEIPAASQSFFHDNNPLREDNKTLESLGVKDGDLLALIVNSQPQLRIRPQQQQQPQEQGGPLRPGPPEDRDLPSNIENVRQQLLQNEKHRLDLRNRAPDLEAVIDDPERFRTLWMERVHNETADQRAHEDDMRRLNDDPFNPEYQQRIADMIRREKVERNLQYAYENNPAVFTQVHMLYVPIKVNGFEVNAFVDSGAQTTIISPSCAQACDLTYLIDERYSGYARGVGIAKIIGKIHNAKIQVGDAELDCAFTVMEGKDVDLLFGLDMLKRHQVCIDLATNSLRFMHVDIPFLSENQIPKAEVQRMLDEPTVSGPDGTEIGAISGTVRPQGTAAAAHQQLQSPSVGLGPSDQSSPTRMQLLNRQRHFRIIQQQHQEERQRQMRQQQQQPQPQHEQQQQQQQQHHEQHQKLQQQLLLQHQQRQQQQQLPSLTSRPAQTDLPPSPYSEVVIIHLMALGVSRARAIQALDQAGGNADYAAGLLFGS